MKRATVLACGGAALMLVCGVALSDVALDTLEKRHQASIRAAQADAEFDRQLKIRNDKAERLRIESKKEWTTADRMNFERELRKFQADAKRQKLEEQPPKRLAHPAVIASRKLSQSDLRNRILKMNLIQLIQDLKIEVPPPQLMSQHSICVCLEISGNPLLK